MKPLQELLGSCSLQIARKVEKTFPEKLKTVRLQNQKISEIDPGLSIYSDIEVLSLTGNFIEKVENLPRLIKILHLNANKYILMLL
jgi:Leucine-rich repeat (LRR) protein